MVALDQLDHQAGRCHFRCGFYAYGGFYRDLVEVVSGLVSGARDDLSGDVAAFCQVIYYGACAPRVATSLPVSARPVLPAPSIVHSLHGQVH